MKGNCVERCPETYLPDSKNICKTCSELDASKPYFDKDYWICLKECKNNSIISGFTCKSCTKEKKVEINGSCSYCPISPTKTYYHEYYENGVQVVKCIDLIKDGKYLDNGKIVDSCPIGKVANSNNECQKCLFYKKKCVLTCPEKYIKDENNIWKSCKERGLFYYNGSCLSKCPFSFKDNIFTYSDTKDLNTCKQCKEKGYLTIKSEGKCVSTYPPYYPKDEVNLICQDCEEEFKLEFKNKNVSKCLDSCPYGFEVDTKNNRCVKSKYQLKYRTF